jgi:ATP synthase protein I
VVREAKSLSIAGDQDPDSDANVSMRLDRLDARLQAAHQAEAARTVKQSDASAAKGYALGNRVIAELVGGMAGGAIVGGTIDHFTGTSPLALLVLLFLGVGVAFRNIIRLSNQRPE